ncbi:MULTISPECIES: hypothetical protein [Priestia]|uniref:Uncharacterized protein n=1 Tax=Priestia aryabhattai TaxID=412384 RepID=A0ABD7X3R6_PRIAR|nr:MULTISPECIES: hypothetical protein [Priestia]MEB4858307.1 hypothetical protein [Priestia megaterium]WEA47140.1 hypothetical protein PWO00_27955 [Priestia aryabhattai]
MKKWLWIMLSFGVIFLVFVMNHFLDKSQQQPNMILSVSLTTSTSPNQRNIVEVKKMYKQTTDYFDYEQKQKADSLRMYYGQPGSTLNQYKELQGIQPSMIHDVNVYWKSEQNVIINIMKTNLQHKNKVYKRFNYNLNEM